MKSPCLFTIPIISVFCLVLASCGKSAGQDAEEWDKERDRIESISIISIDDALPPLHRGHLLLKGDTLLIYDSKSMGKMFTAYEINKGITLGSFGNFGNGPGEMANIGGLYIDEYGILYGLNMNSMSIQGIDIDKGLADGNTPAFTKVRLDTSDGLNPVTDSHYVNDSTVFCSVYVDGDSGYVTHFGRLNPVTGERAPIDTLPAKTVGRNNICVDVDSNRVYMTGRLSDRIHILDLDGNLLKTVCGPDYSERYDGHSSYHIGSLLGGGLLYSVYSGADARKQPSGKDIVVMDRDGRYIKTLRFNSPIWGMAYHEGTNRLYLSTLGVPQFGYIRLDD